MHAFIHRHRHRHTHTHTRTAVAGGDPERTSGAPWPVQPPIEMSKGQTLSPLKVHPPKLTVQVQVAPGVARRPGGGGVAVGVCWDTSTQETPPGKEKGRTIHTSVCSYRHSYPPEKYTHINAVVCMHSYTDTDIDTHTHTHEPQLQVETLRREEVAWSSELSWLTAR
jgi:hypothetical protein